MKAKILFNRLIDGETNVNDISIEYGEGFINDGKLYINFDKNGPKKISDLDPVGNVAWNEIEDKIAKLESSVKVVENDIKTIKTESDITYGVGAPPLAGDEKVGDIYIQYSND